MYIHIAVFDKKLSCDQDTVLQAELVGRDAPTDIGILRIPSRGRLADSFQLQLQQKTLGFGVCRCIEDSGG